MSKPELLKCVVIDDEPPAREIIRRYIDALPMLEFAGEFGNAIEAMAFLQRHPVDLLFLDIRLPQLKGNEFMKALKNPPPVIFTTAHAEYALEGYELDVIDYLLKPIQFDRFIKAVNKALTLKGRTLQETVVKVEENKDENFVYFRADRKMIKVLLADICYIESMKDYVKVFTEGETIITKQSLNSVELMLPEKKFIRTHRSFIASLGKVKSFTHEVLEINKKEIPIGKLFRANVLKALGSGGN